MSQLARRIRKLSAQIEARLHAPSPGRPLVFTAPCYWIVDVLTDDSVIVDMGLGFDADFSMAMIQRYRLTSHGFDPTRKHMPGLQKLADASGGGFHYHPLAIGPERGSLTFHESKENVSGSMAAGHRNIKQDTISTYEVEVITLEDALERAGGASLVKMDIEGPEREVLDGASDSILKSVDQWVIEFHHELIDGHTFAGTKAYRKRFEGLGFRVLTRDNVNFLFYRAG